MPFTSIAQQRAAFGGYLGPEMKAKAEEWAHETPDLKSLPMHVAHSPRTQTRRAAMLTRMKTS